MLSAINKRKELCIKKKQTMQPLILVVGELINLQEYYVYFNEIFYSVNNFLKAVSFNFQLHQVLNIEYAKECRQVWYFIEEHLYKTSATGRKNNSLKALIKQMQN